MRGLEHGPAGGFGGLVWRVPCRANLSRPTPNSRSNDVRNITDDEAMTLRITVIGGQRCANDTR
jgi:hypothetical protein